MGPALDEAERSGVKMEIIWPLQLHLQLDAPDAATINVVSKSQSRNYDGVQDWLAVEALL